MKKYRVTLSSYAYYTVDLDAETEKEAEEKAEKYCNNIKNLEPYDYGAYVVEGETYEI